jgi:hypothetical protein
MKYSIAVFLLLIASCTPTRKIVSDYNSEGFDIRKVKGSNIRLFVSGNVNVDEFKNSFESEYKSKAAFDSIFTNQLQLKLNNIAKVSYVKNDDLDKIFMDQSFSEEKLVKVKEVFESATEDYFLGIKKITISNSMTNNGSYYTPPTTVTTPTGNTSFGGGWFGGGQSEECVVILKAEVWSVKDRKKLSEFTSIGSSTVILFLYGTSLKNAVEDAILNLYNYIRLNQLK